MNRIKQLFIKYKEAVLYLFFGGCTTLVNIVVYYLCDKIGFSTSVSTVIAWILSVIFAFVTNKKWVFESDSTDYGDVAKEVIQFFSCRLGTGIMDLLIMILFVDVLGLNGLLIKILSNILVIILNYFFSKFFIFKR